MCFTDELLEFLKFLFEFLLSFFALILFFFLVVEIKVIGAPSLFEKVKKSPTHTHNIGLIARMLINCLFLF